jgi:hypothetical protein
MSVRNRIKEHRTVKAKDLKPHPLNWRMHPERQKKAMKAMLKDVGFARSVTAYEDPETKELILIDGHLRTELDPEAEVVVEVLDVTPDEAKKLLLTMDPLSMLASTDQGKRDALFQSIEQANKEAEKVLKSLMPSNSLAHLEPDTTRRYHVLVTCTDEKHQLQLLKQFQALGMECKAILS